MKININDLRHIIETIRKQKDFERMQEQYLGEMLPESVAPVIINPIWDALETLLDLYLGEDDFSSWWIWECNCGRKYDSKCWVTYKGERKEFPLHTAEDIMELVKFRHQNE